MHFKSFMYLNGGSIEANFLFDLNLPVYSIAMYIYLYINADPEGNVYKSAKEISNALNTSRKTYLKYRKYLEAPIEKLNNLPLIKVFSRDTNEEGCLTNRIKITDLR